MSHCWCGNCHNDDAGNDGLCETCRQWIAYWKRYAETGILAPSDVKMPEQGHYSWFKHPSP